MSDTQNFQTVARVGEIPEGQGRPYEVDGQPIAIFLCDGTYYALDNMCPHKGVPLDDGLVFDKSVTCMWHGWRFSLEDGRHLDGLRSCVTTFTVRVVDEEIQVSLS
ncbi:nitrite reductase small subunit NirD [Singulisphaera sp. PoT]|uniref:nitrite reductase small subunit NirD n=1 Tax=Singulisphaera sp. PoT TaxID=3411797 RepID=UPI003BF5E2F4